MPLNDDDDFKLKIPVGRTMLLAILEGLGDEKLSATGRELHAMAVRIVNSLYRRSPIKNGDVKSKRVTRNVARQILEIYEAEPGLHNDEIARRVGVNAGRVSEVLRGDRYPDLIVEMKRRKAA